jgi:hypothetical protein
VSNEEADVLCLSIGKPRKATGVDIVKESWFDATRRERKWSA